MTQEQKELLLKDLCGRLPYDVFVNINDIKCVLQPHDISDLIKCDTDIKPYLFPLSTMTKEQKKEYAHILVMCSNLANCQLLGMTVEDFFHKNHLDYRGLIPMGLANDATGLNIY